MRWHRSAEELIKRRQGRKARDLGEAFMPEIPLRPAAAGPIFEKELIQTIKYKLSYNEAVLLEFQQLF